MQKLHLVGVTTDRDGLILSVRRGARSGSYLLPVDDDLLAAVDEHRQHQAEQEEAPEEEVAASPRPESTLPVREIQARLRRGRSVAEVAKAAGVDEAWVERFAPPVLAERARVIAAARGLSLDRPRLGPSVVPLGEAVARHLADRGVSMTPEEQAERWTAHLLDGGRWTVRFAFRYRGKERVLAYELDESAGALAALDRTSGQMGYVAPSAPSGGSRSGSAPPGRERSEPSRPSRERERATAAMRKVATRQAADAERAVARRAKERAKLAASQPTPDATEPTPRSAPTGAAKKAKASPKKPAKPAKEAAGPAKKPAKPAKEAAGPAKKPAKPAKAAAPTKKATAPATKGAKPANKATKAAKKTPATASGPTSTGATASGSAGDTAGAAPEATRIAPDRVAPTWQVGSARSSAAGDPERAVDEPPAIPRQDPGAPGARRVVPPRTPLERARARDGEPSRPPLGTEGAAERAPRFRFNLVEPADAAPRPASPEDGEDDDVASRSAVDPARRPRRPTGRPPRTRPLRAT